MMLKRQALQCAQSWLLHVNAQMCKTSSIPELAPAQCSLRWDCAADFSCGCMDYGFARAKQPWEASDGAVYLLREVAACAGRQAAAQLPVLADIAALEGYSGCWHLKANIWQQLGEMSQKIGVAAFEPHLERFVTSMLSDAACSNQLCRTAAADCIKKMQRRFGRDSFVGYAVRR